MEEDEDEDGVHRADRSGVDGPCRVVPPGALAKDNPCLAPHRAVLLPASLATMSLEVEGYENTMKLNKSLRAQLTQGRQECRKSLKPALRLHRQKLLDFKNDTDKLCCTVKQNESSLRARVEALQQENRQLETISENHEIEEQMWKKREQEKKSENEAWDARIQVLMDRLVTLLSAPLDSTNMLPQIIEEFERAHQQLDTKNQFYKEQLEDARRENRSIAVRLSEEQANTKRLHDVLCERQCKMYGQRQQRSLGRIDFDGPCAEPRRRQQAVSSTAVVSPPVADEPVLLSSGLDENGRLSPLPSPVGSCWSPTTHWAGPRSPNSCGSPWSPKSNSKSLEEDPVYRHGPAKSQAGTVGGANQAIIEERLKKVMDAMTFNDKVVRLETGLYRFGDNLAYLRLSPEGEVFASSMEKIGNHGAEWLPIEEFVMRLCCKSGRKLPVGPWDKSSKLPDLASIPALPNVGRSQEDLSRAGDDAAGRSAFGGPEPLASTATPAIGSTADASTAPAGDDAAGREASPPPPPRLTSYRGAVGESSSGTSLGGDAAGGWHRSRTTAAKLSTASTVVSELESVPIKQFPQTDCLGRPASMGEVTNSGSSSKILSTGDAGSFTAPPSSLAAPTSGASLSAPICNVTAPPAVGGESTSAETPSGQTLPFSSVSVIKGGSLQAVPGISSSGHSVTPPFATPSSSLPTSPQPGIRFLSSAISMPGMISPTSRRRVVTPSRSGAGKACATSPQRIASQMSGAFSPQTARLCSPIHPGTARADAPPPVSRLSSRPGTPRQGVGQPGCFAPPRSPDRCTATALVSPRMVTSPRSVTPTVVRGHTVVPALGAPCVGSSLSAPIMTGAHAAGSAALATGVGVGTPRTPSHTQLARGVTMGTHLSQAGVGGSLDLPVGGMVGSIMPSSKPRSMSGSPPPRPRSPSPLGPVVARAQTPGRFVKAATVMATPVQAWK